MIEIAERTGEVENQRRWTVSYSITLVGSGRDRSTPVRLKPPYRIAPKSLYNKCMDAKTLISSHTLAQRSRLPAAWLKIQAEQGRIPSRSAGQRLIFSPEAVEWGRPERTHKEHEDGGHDCPLSDRGGDVPCLALRPRDAAHIKGARSSVPWKQPLAGVSSVHCPVPAAQVSDACPPPAPVRGAADGGDDHSAPANPWLIRGTGRSDPMKAGKNKPIPATAKKDEAMLALIDDQDPDVAALANARVAKKGEGPMLARLGTMRRIAGSTGGVLPPYLVDYGSHNAGGSQAKGVDHG